MIFNHTRLWQKFPQHIGLAMLSALLTVVCFASFYSDWAALPISALFQTPSAPIIRPVATKVLQRDPFEQTLIGLRQLSQTAPRISIEQLEADEYDGVEIALPNEVYDGFTPRQYQIPAHPSNFGDRFKKDLRGHPVHNKLLIVLHETTSATAGAVNEMLTSHLQDQDQVSYHAIVRQDGTILYLVDPIKRAYGAGDSVFKGPQGSETVQTKKSLASSVNNFAYHISLETPSDGYHNNPEHSGYSDDQYQSLAWLIARSGVESSRITTHVAIDQSGQRQDPRSFDMAWLQTDLVFQANALLAPGLLQKS